MDSICGYCCAVHSWQVRSLDQARGDVYGGDPQWGSDDVPRDLFTIRGYRFPPRGRVSDAPWTVRWKVLESTSATECGMGQSWATLGPGFLRHCNTHGTKMALTRKQK